MTENQGNACVRCGTQVPDGMNECEACRTLSKLIDDCVWKMVSRREALAAYAHEAWVQIAAANLPYLVNAMSEAGHGIDMCDCTICKRIERHRSLMVPYADLPEAEKESDRVQADRILAVLNGVR